MHMDIYKIENCAKIIVAACCLHNVCMYDGFDCDSTFPETIFREDEKKTTTGTKKRDLIRNLLANI